MTIGNSAFRGTSITILDLEDAINLTEIGGYAFSGTSQLQTVIFPSEGVLETIGASSFENSNLTGYIILPSSLNNLGGVSFSGNSLLTQIFMPASLVDVGRGLFGGRKNLLIKYGGASIPSTWNINWNNGPAPVEFNSTP